MSLTVSLPNDVLSQLSVSGANYVTQTLDPYHDYNLSLVGIPDANDSASYLRYYKGRISVTKPNTPAYDGGYDLHVFNTPFLDSDQRTFMDYDADTCTWGPARTPVQAPTTVASVICAVIVPVGKTIADPDAVWQTMSTGSSSTACRFVSGGFEVHNTTPEMYRSGSVTVYRKPPTVSRANATPAPVLIPDTAEGREAQRRWNVHNTFAFVDGPAMTVEAASAMAGSTAWTAAEGCYVPLLPDVRDTSYTRDVYYPHFLRMPPANSASNPSERYYVGLYTAIPPKNESPSTSVPQPTRTQIGRVYQSGAIFTGLAPESTFTIDMRVVYEFAPSDAASDRSLARIATPYDPRALELVVQAARILPPGVKVNENSFGDWWKRVRSVLSSVAGAVAGVGRIAGPVLSALPDPRARALGMVVNGGAHFAGQVAEATSGRFLHTTRAATAPALNAARAAARLTQLKRKAARSRQQNKTQAPVPKRK